MAYRRDEFILQPLQALALGGIAERPQKPACLDLAFDEIVRCAFLQGLFGHRLVVQASEHHERYTWCRGVGPPYRTQPLCIGQPKVQQYHVDDTLRKIHLSLAHALHMRQFDVVRILLAEHLSEQTSVPKIIFDQKNCVDQFHDHLLVVRAAKLPVLGREPLPSTPGSVAPRIADLAVKTTLASRPTAT